ncbi:hypothetical protein CPB86DRAFT_730345 [Serendipita vermifera]|nr:hypothetical protein CPB86DRAFT_730345 [Serendipita vermifera]
MASNIVERAFSDIYTLYERAAPDQAGVISGINPIKFSTTDPIRIWVVQAAIIILTAQLLSLVLSRLRQPRVIAEVIGGVILGPTVMGRIPGFTKNIFPTESLPFLSLTATIGLVLYLFITALEVDVRIIKNNARSSLLISIAGILLPFGLGAAVAVPIYNTLAPEGVNFGYFILFTGVAMSITAFPVLCRILSELKLLENHVGLIVLSAGVGNDVIGWVLLALTVALVNSTGGLKALWVLLSTIAYTLFLLFPVKWAYIRLARMTGSIERGNPSPLMMIVTLLIVFISAFMTDILGVHAIFGGFIAGLIVPHDNGFAIAMVEKMEDLITLLFIPLYFTLSGLKTNLSLLNTGIIWGYIILLCVVAFVGKFLGCAITARLCKFNLRESSTIGILMSCKGLVELIVLNIGLQAGILDQKTFSAFVVMAIVLTCMTTPLTLWVYPPKYRIPQTFPAKEKKDVEETTPERAAPRGDDDGFKSRFSVALSRIEHLPAAMALTQLLHPTSSLISALQPSAESLSDVHTENNDNTPSPPAPKKKSVHLDALRLIELSDRTSAVMKSSEIESIEQRDPLLSILRTFGFLNNIPVTTSASVVLYDGFANSLVTHARNHDSDLVILPWRSGNEDNVSAGYNPFEGLFGRGKEPSDDNTSGVAVYSQFARRVFATSHTDVALFIDRGVLSSASLEDGTSSFGQHILFPFIGGPDDRIALSLVVQLCSNTGVTATVFRVQKVEDDALSPAETTTTDAKHPANPNISVLSQSGFPDTLYAPPTTQTRMESQTADHLALSRFVAPPGGQRAALPRPIEDALSRVKFEDMVTATPLHTLIERANTESATNKKLLIVCGRSRRMATESHHAELRTIVQENAAKGVSIGGDISRTVGEIATACLSSAVKANLLVIQAALPQTAEE